MLKIIQQNFQQGIWQNQPTKILPDILTNHISAESRFKIYRQTILQNLCRALELTFPAIWSLVGQECADNLALAFIHDPQHLPQTNCLEDWGEKFPGFIRSFTPLAHLYYLQDVAQVEWLKHLSYGAADYIALEPEFLHQQLLTVTERLILTCNPTLHLFSCSYSLRNIFSLLENPQSEIYLQAIPNFLILSRYDGKVKMHWVTEDIFNFLQLIQQKHPVQHAYATVIKNFPEFDLIAAWQFILENELLARE